MPVPVLPPLPGQSLSLPLEVSSRGALILRLLLQLPLPLLLPPLLLVLSEAADATAHRCLMRRRFPYP